MKSISAGNGNAKITLDSRFYSLEKVREAVNDFREACDARITNAEKIEICITPKQDDGAEEIALEFCNYVLSLCRC